MSFFFLPVRFRLVWERLDNEFVIRKNTTTPSVHTPLLPENVDRIGWRFYRQSPINDAKLRKILVLRTFICPFFVYADRFV